MATRLYFLVPNEESGERLKHALPVHRVTRVLMLLDLEDKEADAILFFVNWAHPEIHVGRVPIARLTKPRLKNTG